MTNKTIRIAIPADGEGFVALRCPHCQGDFKVLVADWEQYEGTDLYCARCGLSHERAVFLLRPDVEAVARQHAENLAVDAINDLSAQLERAFRNSPLLKVTTNRLPKKAVAELRAITDLAVAELPCCETTVKVSADQAASLLYCPFCGQVQR